MAFWQQHPTALYAMYKSKQVMYENELSKITRKIYMLSITPTVFVGNWNILKHDGKYCPDDIVQRCLVLNNFLLYFFIFYKQHKKPYSIIYFLENGKPSCFYSSSTSYNTFT